MSDAVDSGEDAETGGPTGSEAPIYVEDSDHFETVVADEHVVLADFYADWCGPCKMLEPILETVAAETAATVLKVDVDEHDSLAREFEIRGVPTLYLFVDGEETERMVGLQDEDSLTELIAEHA